MSEKKLDLLQLAASGVALAGARPRRVMRGEHLYFRPVRARLHYVLNTFCVIPFPQTVVLAYRSEELAADISALHC